VTITTAQQPREEHHPASHGDEAPPLTFGIYPGRVTADAHWVDAGEAGVLAGPPDAPVRIRAALDQLQGAARAFVVRGYLHYVGGGQTANQTPAAPEQYVDTRRTLELVLCFRDPQGDLAGWLNVIRATVRRHGPHLVALQIAEEPNNPDPTRGGDGSFPNVLPAIIQGVIAAKEEAHRLGHGVQVGFNATPSLPGNDFWDRLGALVTPAFLDALDYIGLDFFPDVFRPIAPDNLGRAVAAVLTAFRETSARAGHIPRSVPIHIGENGWPTGPHRPEERQAAVLETIVRTVDAQRGPCNVTHYEFFDLRDADSSKPDIFDHFGLLRDDYTPKPAFETYRRLIAELGETVGS